MRDNWPLVSIFGYKDKINPTPQYQRYAVWSRKQQQLLLDSVHRGMDIPKLYLREVDDGPFKYEAVDGQQRLRAIWEFFEGKYALSSEFSPELAGQKYNDLSMPDRQKFDLYQVSLVIIKTASDSEIREMFCRLQNGKPLNSAEKRNAMVSDMRDFCAELAEHPFFNSVRFGNGRMQFQQVAAQTVLLEMAAGPASCKTSLLSKLYEDYRSFDPKRKEAKKIRKVYDFLQRCFPERAPELKSGYVVSLYLLCSQLMEEYSLNGREETVREFLIDFDYRRRTHDDDDELARFGQKMRDAADGEEAVRFRHDLLRREFHAFCPDLIPLDSQRGFDEAQRTVIYRRDGGRCKYCGTPVTWGKFNADHVVAHSKGGPTSVENGWLACDQCNKKKGAKTLQASE